MTTLTPHSCRTLTFCGVWRLSEGASSVSRFVYNAYGSFVLVVLYCTFVSQVMALLTNLTDLVYFVNVAFTAGSALNACCKATFLFLRRDKVISLLLAMANCPYETNERKDDDDIKRKFDRMTRTMFFGYAYVLLATGIGLNLKCLLSLILFNEPALPFPVWHPWNQTSTMPNFLGSWACVSVGMTYVASSQVGIDTMSAGLMIGICAQLEILESHLDDLSSKATKTDTMDVSSDHGRSVQREILNTCIGHHNYILVLSRELNRLFNPVFFSQFFISMLMLCLTVYHLSVTSVLTAEFLVAFSFLLSALMQSFLYCWHANEVTLKSQDTVYRVFSVGWMELRVTEQKDLLFVMMRTATPIVFTSSFLVTLSLEAFVNIIKTSYSVFSLMKSQSDEY